MGMPTWGVKLFATGIYDVRSLQLHCCVATVLQYRSTHQLQNSESWCYNLGVLVGVFPGTHVMLQVPVTMKTMMVSLIR